MWWKVEGGGYGENLWLGCKVVVVAEESGCGKERKVVVVVESVVEDGCGGR